MMTGFSSAATRLSADNTFCSRTEIIDALRQAAADLGLRPHLIATLDAMLSFLPKQRDHHIVFASNRSLSERRNGLGERSLRRHVIELETLGFLRRNDSANKKRYSRVNPKHGTTLRFGFDLTPLFHQLTEIRELARKRREEQQALKCVKAELRALIQLRLAEDPHNASAQTAQQILKKKPSVQEIETCIKNLSPKPIAPNKPESANDGQNDRHNKTNKKEEKTTAVRTRPIDAKHKPFSVNELTTACPEVAALEIGYVKTASDVVQIANDLRPMIGLSTRAFATAQETMGSIRTAVTIWGMVSCISRIKSADAYILTLAKKFKKNQYDPFTWIRRLSADNGRCDE